MQLILHGSAFDRVPYEESPFAFRDSDIAGAGIYAGLGNALSQDRIQPAGRHGGSVRRLHEQRAGFRLFYNHAYV